MEEESNLLKFIVLLCKDHDDNFDKQHGSKNKHELHTLLPGGKSILNLFVGLGRD